MENIILIVGFVIVGVIIAIYLIALLIGMKSIFKGSGAPISMAQALLSSIHITIQHMVGVLIILIISLLIIEKIVTVEAGLPLLSAVSGYLLAKTFKDVNISPTRKTEKNANED